MNDTSNRPIIRARIARSFRHFARVRGWQSLVNRFVPEHGGAFTVSNGDVLFAGDISSFIDRQVYLFGGYDTAQIRCFLSMLSPGRRSTILDIGANAGTHSLAFARVFDRVEAFEPNERLWPQFERNIAQNQLKNVRLHRVGLGDADAELTLYGIDKPNYGLGTFSTVEQYDLPLRPIGTSRVLHPARYLAEIGVQSVDAVKIDVQGFEAKVLSGLEPILERDRPIIWCEIGMETLGSLGTTDKLSKLVPFEYRSFEIVSSSRWLWRSCSPVERTGELATGDYIIVPR